MTAIPNHNERQMMQRLRGRGWVKAVELPVAPMIITRLLERRWIETEGTGKDLAFKLTEEGLAAKKAPIPSGRIRGIRNSEIVQSDEGIRLHQAD
jgi:chromosome segregation and condensation protein ScpB